MCQNWRKYKQNKKNSIKKETKILEQNVSKLSEKEISKNGAKIFLIKEKLQNLEIEKNLKTEKLQRMCQN